MKKDYAVVFKRGEFIEGKGSSLEPIGYIEGNETVFKGKRFFVIDPAFRNFCLEDEDSEKELEDGEKDLNQFLKNNKKIGFIDDRVNFSSKYVYGSPFNTSILKDLISYNFAFADETVDDFNVTIDNSSFQGSIDYLKSRYVEALKQYNFYQNVMKDGIVETICERKEPLTEIVNMENIIPEMFEDEIGMEFPEDYDFETEQGEAFKPVPSNIDVKKIYEATKKYIKGQDKHILPILSAINDNLMAEMPEEKSNILVAGPTGCGKTAVFKRIADLVGLPIVIEDSTQFTKAGYVGRDIGDIFEDLLEAADGDLELAQKGIIIIDEIDKKASGNDDSVSGVGVLQSMLKLLEGGNYTYETGNGMSTVLKTVNTLNITFAFGGAFSGLAEQTEKRGLGFGREEENVKKVKTYDVENLDRYGIPPEFYGRITLLEVFDKLSVDSLKEILLTAKINPLDLFIKKMKRYNTDVVISDGFVEELAKEAETKGSGARGLYKVMKDITKVAQGEIELLESDVEKILTLTPECVHNNEAYNLEVQKVKTKTLKRIN